MPRGVGKRHTRDQDKADRIFQAQIPDPVQHDGCGRASAGSNELSGVLQNAEVNALVEIFKSRAEMEQGPTDERHKMRAAAQSQRVQTEEDGMPQRVTVLESAV